MSPWQGIILGVVQGLSEFLPISSSGHLVLVPWLFRWPEHSLSFDVALHMGTLGALLAYFWRQWWELLAAWLPPPAPGTPWVGIVAPPAGTPSVASEKDEAAAERARKRRLGIGLVIATLPGAIFGALLSSRVESALHSPVLIALLLIVAGILLAAADRAGVQQLGLDGIGNVQALIVGCAQALALAPGVSRSGATIAAGLFLGLTREAAARYSFLLAAPITAGAGIFELRHVLRDGVPADERLAFGLGILASLGVGFLVIGSLLRYLRYRNLNAFVGYRIIFGVFVILVALVRR